jgi:predicted transcriptional regulator
MRHRLTIRVPDDIRHSLDQISEKERVPVSDVAAMALRRYVAVYRARSLRGERFPRADARGRRSEDHVLGQLE